MNQELGNLVQRKPIKSFTDLDAWKEGHNLVLMIYERSKSFPKEEMFGLTSQLRRAVVSITFNIAEGFSRQSYKDKLYFYSMSLGSLTEAQNQLFIARDLKYTLEQDFNKVYEQTIRVSKILNGLIKSSKSIIRNS
jgi:four helix bundle protein